MNNLHVTILKQKFSWTMKLTDALVKQCVGLFNNIEEKFFMLKVQEDEHFYNNRYIVNNNILTFERVYMVDENQFDNGSYEMLGKIYEQLPSFMGKGNTIPSWFGNEEKGDEFFINVSFEMSGLQFIGNIPISDFLHWENKFHDLIRKLPFKYQ